MQHATIVVQRKHRENKIISCSKIHLYFQKVFSQMGRQLSIKHQTLLTLAAKCRDEEVLRALAVGSQALGWQRQAHRCLIIVLVNVYINIISILILLNLKIIKK